MKTLIRALLVISLAAYCVASEEIERISVHIVGNVNKPGQYDIPASENFQKSIQLYCGGFKRMTHLTSIKVSRKIVVDGKESRTVFIYDFRKPDDRTVGITLINGDIIFVPQTIK
jgi:protein involved in polysaccharide export with SLBB domain